MKAFLAALALCTTLTGAASAAEAPKADTSLFIDGQVGPTDAYWIGRYGQPCFHGPVWLPECHALGRPGFWVPGHWNYWGTRWIPGHYA